MSYAHYRIISVIVVVLLVGTVMYSEAQGAAANFYVATNGNDAWSGRLPAPNVVGTDGPFATLSRARDAIRELKANGGLHQPLKVLVRGGTYYLPETFTLGSEDSGTASFPITYMAYSGEKVVLSGGRPISGWKPYQGKIWQCDLNALGLGELSFKQLFYNGQRQPLARFPNVDPQHPRTGGFLYAFEGGRRDSKQLLKYDPAKLDPSKWARPTLVEVDVYPHHNWNNNIIPIVEIDEANHIIKLAEEARYELRQDTRFYIRNAFEELDAPGEWYLDSETATLYFWPPDAALARGQVGIPALDRIIQVGDEADTNSYVRYLRIGGFSIQVCQGRAMDVRAAQHCTIAKCTITNTGENGILVGMFCTDNRVVGNDIAHIGRWAIAVYGRHNLISNNHLHDTGIISKDFNRAVQLAGRGNIMSHNLIHDLPGFGMTFHGHDLVIEYNDFHHFGLETNLAGAIYAISRHSVDRPDPTLVGGNILRFNKITDSVGYGMVSSREWGTYGGSGIWLDDWVSNTTIYGNILVRNKHCGVNIHGGTNNIVENNIMGAGIPSTYNHIRPGDELCNNRIVRNIVYYANADPRLRLQIGWLAKSIIETVASSAAAPAFLCGWSSVKAAVSESDYNVLFPMRGVAVDTMLYFDGAGQAWRGPWADAPVEDRFAWWRSLGYEAHSIIADPLFVDVANDDFRLRPESPAFQLGFKPIPQERIGLYPSPNRASWPVDDGRQGWQAEVLVRPVVTPAQTRPELKVPKGAAGIIVDGDVSEWPWHDTTRMVALEQQSNGQPTWAPKSYASVAYDDEALYIAVRNLVRDAKRLKSTGEWGKKDVVEIPFQDVSGEEPGPVLNLYGFPDGHFEGVTEANTPTGLANKLASAVTYAAQIGSDYWSCEWRIPWAATGIDPRQARKLWFNIGVYKSVSEAWIAWKGTGAANYYLENAGDLLLRP